MLELLRIKNLALIEDVELEFTQGLNVITGESGTGKSIILKSLDFALGENIPHEMIRPNKDKAFVEALFLVKGEEILIRRELLKNPRRSRIYINDSLSSKTKIKELREKLIIYTSQHEQHKLLRPEYHTKLVDEYLPEDLLKEKQELIKQLNDTQHQLQNIEHEISLIDSQKDFLLYQLKEIKKVSPEPREDESLLKKREELKKIVKLGEDIQRALEILSSEEYSLIDHLTNLCSIIRSISVLDPKFVEVSEQLEHTKETLFNLEAHLKNYPIGVEQVAELESIESRLFEIEQLKKKLNKSLDEIIELKDSLEDIISKRDNLFLELKNKDKERGEILSKLEKVIYHVNEARKQKGISLAKNLKKELIDLGFNKDIEIKFEFSPVEIFPHVVEQRPRIMWRPNPGQPMQPLDQIVSGGELSRIFLALITTTGEELPTLIFDEVDTGIGGLTLTKVGKKLKELSNTHQIILITHWPQLACIADNHFRVYKEIINSKTFTKCDVLQGDEVKKELSRMAGGGVQGDALATELLKEKP